MTRRLIPMPETGLLFRMLVALLLTTTVGRLPAAAHGPPLLIRNVNIIPMDREQVLSGLAVYIEDGRIAQIGTRDSLQTRPDVIERDGRRGFLVPGLIDAHVHVREQTDLLNYLANGVTTVLDLGEPTHRFESLLALRVRIDRGEIAGPRIFLAGEVVASHVQVESPSAAREHVARVAALGANYIKLYNGTSRPVFDALVAAAREHGLSVFGHVPREFDHLYSIGHGLDVIVHAEELYFSYFGGPRDQDLPAYDPIEGPDLSSADALIETMRANDVAVIPNLIFTYAQLELWDSEAAVLAEPESAYLSSDQRRAWISRHSSRGRPNFRHRIVRERIKYGFIHDLTLRLHRAGILLGAGTDAALPGLHPGLSLHKELRELTKTGLSFYEVLATATHNNGELIRRHVRTPLKLGQITPGFQADLVLLAGNPLEDIRHSESILAVIKDGVWHEKSLLDRRRAGQGGQE